MSENDKSFSVWHDNQEQWDPDDIDEPAFRCRAPSPLHAAERCADQSDDTVVNVIVRDDAADTYRQIELVRTWSVKSDSATSVAELSAP